MLKFFSSVNSAVNSKRAIGQAIEDALAGEPDAQCDLLVIHATIGHNLKEMLGEARRMLPEAEIIGCTVAGVIGKEGVHESMRSLGVMAIKGPRSEFAVASRDNLRGNNSFDIAKDVATDLKNKNGKINMVMLLASGIDIAADRSIAGMESVLGKNVPIFGGTASDNMRGVSTFQWLGEKIYERGVVAIGFADPTLSLIGRAHHGSVPVGMPFVVTKSEANRIDELDGQPAWPYLMGKLNVPVDTPIGMGTIPISGLGQELEPEFHSEYDNKHVLRAMFHKDAENKAFFHPVDTVPGTKLWLMQRDENLIFEGGNRMIKRLVDDLKGRQPVAVFHADCGARGRVMFNRVLKEEYISGIQVPINQASGSDVPWLGMYGFGEFCPLGGKNRFHTFTSAVYCIVRN